MSSQLETVHSTLKADFQKAPFPSAAERIQLLKKIKQALLAHEEQLYTSFEEDYGKRDKTDSLLGDILPSVRAIDYCLANIKRWMKPSKRKSGLFFFPSSVSVFYQPLGVVGIIAPWNFPVFLSISPLSQALSAGNKVMLKLSEHTPETNKVLRLILACVEDSVKVIEGGPEVGAEFSTLPFDHLVFTGSTTIGKEVSKSSCSSLTPLTLELGGKSPLVVDEGANLDRAVESAVLGKVFNRGQLCVAPDYALVHENIFEAFLNKCSIASSAYSPSTAIINSKQELRLKEMLTDALEKGAVMHGSDSIDSVVFLTRINDSMQVMQKEIFGPILPVISFSDISEAMETINAKPSALAVYLFSSNKKSIDLLLTSTKSGGFCINDAVVQAAVEDAPFGGVGDSGLGRYHGFEGFKTFSNPRAVLRTPTWLPRNYLLLKHKKRSFKILRKIFL